MRRVRAHALIGLLLALAGCRGNPLATNAPGPVTVAATPREILPMKPGDRFHYLVHYLLPWFPSGTLDMAVQKVEVAGQTETIDLTLSLNVLFPGNPAPHQVVLKDGMFQYDAKPFIPERMQLGDTWKAQDGTARVVARETLDLSAGHFPDCYRVAFDNPKGETLTLWFAPHVGLVKGTFDLALYSQGSIELASGP